MKAVFIPYNQTHKEYILELLEKSNIRGFSMWDSVQGKGSESGEPHYGTHAWPTLNGAILTIIPDEKTDELLRKLHEMDKGNKNLGLHAYVWSVEKMV